MLPQIFDTISTVHCSPMSIIGLAMLKSIKTRHISTGQLINGPLLAKVHHYLGDAQEHRE
jgi:hypothetical protein